MKGSTAPILRVEHLGVRYGPIEALRNVTMVQDQRSVVALLGRPNAGKSALLNALVGEKLAIVSPRAQTTRGRMLGVVTRPGAQFLLHDTPGLHPGEREFNRLLCERALETVAAASRLLAEPGGDR